MKPIEAIRNHILQAYDLHNKPTNEMATQVPQTIIYREGSDWRRWNNIFTDKVEAAGLKEAIFGDDALMTKPPRKPQYSDYEKAPDIVPRPATRSTTVEPELPTRATGLDELSKDHRDIINARFMHYDRDLKQWNWELKVVGELKNWFRTSLDQHSTHYEALSCSIQAQQFTSVTINPGLRTSPGPPQKITYRQEVPKCELLATEKLTYRLRGAERNTTSASTMWPIVRRSPAA